MKPIYIECRMCNEPSPVHCTELQITEYYSNSKRFIQDIMPDTPADERELLISGTCGRCFNKLFAGGNE